MKTMHLGIASVAAALGLAAAVWAGPQADQVDPALGSYKVESGVSGNLSSVGSDTLNNLMTLWTETFKKNYPNVVTQVEGKGWRRPSWPPRGTGS